MNQDCQQSNEVQFYPQYPKQYSHNQLRMEEEHVLNNECSNIGICNVLSIMNSTTRALRCHGI